MALVQYIRDLLYLSDKVIVPGFGGFIAHYSPSEFDEGKSSLTPPSKWFSFDSSLIEDDLILSKFLQDKLSVSPKEAKKQIKDQVSAFWEKLYAGETLLLEKIGYFSLDEQKKIRFERDRESNFNIASFGLNEIKVKPLPQAEPENPLVLQESKRFSVWKILLVFLLINIVGATIALVYWKFDVIKDKISSLPLFSHSQKNAQVSVPTKPGDSLIQDTSSIGQSIDTATQIKNALYYNSAKEKAQQADSSEVVLKESSNARYYLIAGSFQTFEKAQLHAKFLKKQGYKPEVIQFEQQLFRVSVGEYSTKDSAKLALDKIKTEKGNTTIWIVVK